MSATNAIARDGNIRNLPRQRGGTPMGSHDRLSAEIPDIFIPLTRNENSGMTIGAIARVADNDRSGILPSLLHHEFINDSAEYRNGLVNAHFMDERKK